MINHPKDEMEAMIDLELEIRGEVTEDDFAGPNSKLVKLISEDGTEFQVKRKHAIFSGRIKRMLENPDQYAEIQNNTIILDHIPTDILGLVIRYWAYRFYFSTTRSGILGLFHIPSEMSLGVLMASSYLDC